MLCRKSKLTIVSSHTCVYFLWAVHESFHGDCEEGVLRRPSVLKPKCAKAKQLFLKIRKKSHHQVTSHSLNCFWPSGHVCVCVPGNLAFWTIPVWGENFSPYLFLPGYCDMFATMKSNPLTFKYRDMEVWKRDAIILFQHTTKLPVILFTGSVHNCYCFFSDASISAVSMMMI